MILCAFLLAGCSPKVVTEYRDRVVYRDRYVADTVSVRDSIHIREYVKGDTVRIAEYRDRWRYKYISVTDTLVIRDTLAVEHIKEVRVEKALSWWQRVRLGAFWWLVLIAAGLLVWTFRRQILQLLKR